MSIDLFSNWQLGTARMAASPGWKAKLPVAILVYTGLQIVAWLAFLYVTVPDISAADYLWAMWHRAQNIEEGRWGRVIASIFELFGGHTAAYTRIEQILNYTLFDYSGGVGRWVAILTYVAAIVSFIWLAWFHFRGPGRPVLVLAGVVLICSPVAWEVITWTDAVLIYFCCFIVACLGLPLICRVLAGKGVSPWRDWALLVAITFAIVIGSGLGWAILPVLPLAWLISRGFIDKLAASRHGIWWLLLGLVATFIIALLTREAVLMFMQAYEQRFWLDDARRSLQLLFENPWLPTRFFLALLATNLMTGSIARMWPAGAALLAAWLMLVGWLAYRRRTAEFSLWITFALFGLFSALLITLARWHIMVGRGDEHVHQYYSIAALPFHIGLVSIALIALQNEKGSALNARAHRAVIALAVLMIAAELLFGHTVRGIWGLRYGGYAKASFWADARRAARFGAQNWNLIHTTGVSGDSIFVQEYLFRLMPEFKLYGKYKALTDPFVDDPKAFAAAEGLPDPLPLELLPMGSVGLCSRGSDGAAVAGVPDTRMQWHHAFRDTAVPFVRFYGYVHKPSSCDQRVDHVLAADSRGRILCVSRTGRYMSWYLPEDWKEMAKLGRDFMFDFSCPLRGETADASPPYTVLAYIRENRQLIVIPAVTP